MDLETNYKWASGRYKLSFREWEVLILILNGKKNTDISKELGLSLSTVYGYEESIKLKTNTRTLCETAKEFCSSFYLYHLQAC